jgi:hypothetical protein
MGPKTIATNIDTTRKITGSMVVINVTHGPQRFPEGAAARAGAPLGSSGAAYRTRLTLTAT